MSWFMNIAVDYYKWIISVLETIKVSILPGKNHMFSPGTALDLSTPGSYEFEVYTILSGDEVPGNDTTTAAFEHINTDIELRPFHSGFRLFPNLFVDQIPMVCDEAENVEVQVVDLTGRNRMIHHYSHLQEGQEREIEMDPLSSGIYIFNIKTVPFAPYCVLIKESTY